MVRNLFNFRFRLTAAIFLVAISATTTGLIYYYQVASQRIWSQMMNRVRDYGKIGVALFSPDDLKFLEKIDADLNSASRAIVPPVSGSGASLNALADDEKTAILRTNKFQLIVQKLRRLRYSSGKAPIHDLTLSSTHSGDNGPPLIHRAWLAGVKMHERAPEFLRVLCADEFEEIDRNNNSKIDPEEAIYHIGDIFNGRGQSGVAAALRGEVGVGNGYRSEYSGVYISGYTPVKDSRGKTVAILVVDFSAATEFDAIFSLKVTGYYIMIGVLLFSIAAAALTSRVLLKPLESMQQAAVRIGRRDFSVRIETRSNDELADLAYAINLMAHELGEYSQHMESRIAMRTGEISGILDSLEQGLLTVDSMGIIQGEYSRQTLSIFGLTEIAHRKFSSLFEDEKLSAAVEQFLAVSFTGQNISRQMLDKANPLREIAYKNLKGEVRHLRFTFRPLGGTDDSKLSRLLVSIVDDTLNFSLRQRIDLAEAAKRNEFDMLIGLTQVPPRILEDFMAQQKAYLSEGKAIISRFESVRPEELADFSRHVHALKGNAAQLGFTALSELLHELENHLQSKALGETGDSRFLRHEISRCINLSEALILDRDKLTERIRALVGTAGREDTAAECRQLRKFWLAQIEQKAALREIPIDAKVEFAPGTENAVHQLHNILVQLVRNTFAHGMQSPAERIAEGKPPEIQIQIRSARLKDGTEISYSEDGRGFRVLSPGETMSLDELRQKGLTAPRKSVTLESGRGLGMDYIAATVHRLGAKATISSENGITNIRFDLPG